MPTSKTIRDGIHKVKIIRAELGESAARKERIELDFLAPDGATTFRHMYLTERARPYTFETLEGFGIDCDDENYIDRIDVLIGKGCKIKVLTPTGKDATPEVVSVWPLDEDRPKPSQDELRARIKKKHAQQPESATATADEYDERENPTPKATKPVTPPPVPPKSSQREDDDMNHLVSLVEKP